MFDTFCIVEFIVRYYISILSYIRHISVLTVNMFFVSTRIFKMPTASNKKYLVYISHIFDHILAFILEIYNYGHLFDTS